MLAAMWVGASRGTEYARPARSSCCITIGRSPRDPSEWLGVLEKVEALAPSIVVPGHGKPLHDLTLLRAHIAAMRIMLAAGADARKRGLDPDRPRRKPR